ncbi:MULTISPECIES: PepSY domain-containing protein [Roseomonadaceae]|uniref:PepSY domain-containing protein n=1 Tax=Falsiroseomonas oleicola TaxID=2801474 RepID=A0ABS6HAA6_9PROT|nr:PepSY domain-containing protein [Roseomonas oleicola]MBU8545660.1 PepSY domain-containing protein [Roseomonas oleicola]
MTTTHLRRAALGLALAAGLAAPAFAQAPAAPATTQTPIGAIAPGGIAIEGQVTDVFGNRFVLQDATGRVLVEAGPDWYHRLDIRQGERLRVIGRPDGGSFDAFTIRREDGREITIRRAEGSPPWAGRPGREARERRDRERREERQTQGGIDEAEARRVAEAAGYRIRGDVERKRRHWEIEAFNPRNERVEIHIDLAGRITREEWDRD